MADVPHFVRSHKALIGLERSLHGHYIRILDEPRFDIKTGKYRALCQVNEAIGIVELTIRDVTENCTP